MFEFMEAAGREMIVNIAQLILGGLLSAPVFFFCKRNSEALNYPFLKEAMWIGAFSILGVIVPLNTYGLIPLLAALLFIGQKFYIVFPLIISNSLFNLSMPFFDPLYTWSTSHRYILFALFTAILGGFALRIFGRNKENLVSTNISVLIENPGKTKGLAYPLSKCINVVGIFLIIGVLINTVFHKYILWNLLSFLATNPYTAFIPRFFSGYDVGNTLFLLAMSIVNTLMDFVKMSAILAMLKPKGTILYLCYHIVWIILLGTSAFI